MDPMQVIYEYIDAHAGEYVRDLQTLVRYRPGVHRIDELIPQRLVRDFLRCVP
jgi:hypothetical protein